MADPWGRSNNSATTSNFASSQQKSVSRVSRFFNRRQHSNFKNDLLVVDDNQIADHVEQPLSTESSGILPTSSDSRDIKTNAPVGRLESSSWLRRGSPLCCREPPYQIPTRITYTKEQRLLSNMWLVKEMKTPDQSGPIWSIAISGDGG